LNAALLIFLVLLWAVFLLPGALRAHRTSPTTSVGTFHRAMRTLARRDPPRSGQAGRYVYVPSDPSILVDDRARRRRELMARRRRLFIRLLAATLVLFPVAVVVGGTLWVPFLVSAACLTVYVGLLRSWKVQADQAAAVVRELPDVAVARHLTDVPGPKVAAGAEADPRAGFQVVTHPAEPWEPQTAVRIRRFDDLADDPAVRAER
jgi:hypothetical protein